MSLCSTLALLAAAAPAPGQTLDATEIATIRVDAAGAPGLSLRTPSAAGSRLGLTPFETPASVDVIEGETIRRRGHQDVNQAIVQNGIGVSFHGTPGNGGTSLGMRGFTGHASVTRLYDGTRLYPASGTITFPFDTWTVDRIEVLRGPASVLYGEGAIGGAINIVPKKPLADRSRNEAQATVGSDGLRGLALGSAGPLGERLAYSLDVHGRESDGWIDNGEASSLALSGGLRWRVNDDLSLTVSHDYGYNKPAAYFGTPLVEGALDERVRERNYNIGDSLIRYRDNFTQIRAEWSPSETVSVSSTAYYLTSDRDWRNVEDYLYQPETGDVRRSFYIAINHALEQVGNRTDATFRTRPGGLENETVIGFDVNRIRFKNTNNSPYGGESTVDFLNPEPGAFGPYTLATTTDTTTNQYALFADNRLTINEQWSVVGGLRYDNPRISRESPAFRRGFDSVNWRLGAVYNPVENVALFAQYSKAAEPIGNILSLADSQKDLSLTTGEQMEAGVKYSFLDGRGDATLSVYNIVKKNLLARDPDDPNITLQIGEQSSRGVEAAIGYDFGSGFRVDANGTLISAEYDDYVQAAGDLSGNRPANAPRRAANLWASWSFAQDWTAQGGVHYIGEVFSNDANTATRSSYTLLNAGLQWRPTDRASLDLNLYNLTDEVYATSGGSTQWLLGAPRTAALSLRVAF